VKRIAVTGGIGAGKSTVVAHLRSRGIVAVDADEVYHELVGRGSLLLHTLVDAFGSAVLTPDGDLDRRFLATVVFNDATALARLDAITHPPIGREMRRQLDAASGDVVVAALPLFRHAHRESLALDEVWSIQVSPPIAVDRLVDQRGMTDGEARARLASQVSNDERAALADEVIWNNTDRESLRQRVDELLRERGLRGH
jgi:dephospho-CoA kinase